MHSKWPFTDYVPRVFLDFLHLILPTIDPTTHKPPCSCAVCTGNIVLSPNYLYCTSQQKQYVDIKNFWRTKLHFSANDQHRFLSPSWKITFFIETDKYLWHKTFLQENKRFFCPLNIKWKVSLMNKRYKSYTISGSARPLTRPLDPSI